MRSIDVIYRGTGDERQIVWKVARTDEAIGQKNLLHVEPASSSNPVQNSGSRPAALFHCGGSRDFSLMVAEAAQLAFPGIKCAEVSQLGDLPFDGANRDALLALCDPDSATLGQIHAQTVAKNGSAQWPVVVFGSASFSEAIDHIDVVTEEEWKRAGVARVLRSAWERHQLRRENARLRGDLLTFGSRIAHDLRTPLGGILTTTEMLREVLAEEGPAKVPLTQPILDSTDGLVKLIERASFFARASASDEPAKKLDMGVPFWGAFQRLESLLLSAQMPFSYPSSWPMVEGHEAWLELSWRTLLTNAIQYAPARTRIEAGWSPEKDGGNRFWVRNQGAIPPARKGTLFHPFHRLHEAGAPRGLGLAMMQRMVELDGGRCGFEESEGNVEFFFVLPEASAPEGLPRAV